MFGWLKSLMNPKPVVPPDLLDAAVSVRTGTGVLIRNGQIMAVIPADGVEALARARTGMKAEDHGFAETQMVDVDLAAEALQSIAQEMKPMPSPRRRKTS
jgi:hypothetical protein